MKNNREKQPPARYMLDIETLGTRPGSVIFEIGCVKFDAARGITARLSHAINVGSATFHGLRCDNETVAWWGKQSVAAREILEFTQGHGGSTLPEGLAALAGFFAEHGRPTELWGNGADFDCVLMGEAYKLTGAPIPWDYFTHRCLRTARALLAGGRRDLVPFTGTKHRALDDAEHEALELLAMEAGRTWCSEQASESRPLQ